MGLSSLMCYFLSRQERTTSSVILEKLSWISYQIQARILYDKQ